MQVLNTLAIELNDKILISTPIVYSLLSDLGKRIYLPKGILSQSAEAHEKADRFNATRAIAMHNSEIMHLRVSKELVQKISADDIYGYAPVLGNPELRKMWEKHLCSVNPLLIDVPMSMPIVTNGITHGLSLLADLFVNEGDVLILPDMMWGNYRLIFQTKGRADISTFPFFNSDNNFNIHEFRETLLRQVGDKLLILLNFPHNPTGYSITRAEGEQIVEAIITCAASGCNILVMIDDAYAGFWYDSMVMHESLFGMLVGSHKNVLPVKIDGATKEEYAWGLRVGFLTFGLGDNIMVSMEQKVSGLIRANTSGASQISQSLILRAMNAEDYIKQKQRNFKILKSRALKVKQVVSDKRYVNLWNVYPSHAGYFICLRIKFGSAERVRETLLNEYGIGTIALNRSDLRVAFSCFEESDIEYVFSTIARVIQQQNSC